MEKNKQLDSYFTEEKISFSWFEYSTDFHNLRVKDLTRENFLAKIGRVDKEGGEVNSTEAQHLMMCEWLQIHAKPKLPKMSGVEWEASMNSLMLEVFKEEWDRFDRGDVPNAADNEGPIADPVEG